MKVEAPSYEEGVGVDGETEGLPSEEGVLGQAKRAELERGLMEDRRVKPWQKWNLGTHSQKKGRPWRGWMLLCYFLRAEES